MNIDSRIRKQSCPRCDLGYVIKDYIKPIIQILTNEIPQFNFRLQTTKCLNTAVMLMIFLAGKQGLDIASYCDTREVAKRHQSGQDDNKIIMQSLKKQILSKKEKSRTLYYILLTDGYFPKSASQPSNVYFPGHVLILEKLWDEQKQEHYFYFYQSYINQYTLQQHIELNRGLRIDYNKTKQIINNLHHILHSKEWQEDNVTKWKEITFTNSSNFMNTLSKGNFFLCFKKVRTNVCYKYLLAYLKKVNTNLNNQPTEDENKIYGDVSLYDTDASPLTNKQMKESVASLMSKINIYKKKS